MKALLIFCEGAHDVSLLYRLLPRLPGVEKSKRKLQDYPAPFAGFWKSQLGKVMARVETRPAEHRGKLTPPWLELSCESNDVLYMVFSMSGKDQRGAIGKLLNEWKRLMSPEDNPFAPPDGRFDTWAAAFVLDADDAGVEARQRDLFDWLVKEKLVGAPPETGSWARSGGYAVGGFVVHGPDSTEGSIEDHWIPIVEAVAMTRLEDARKYLRAHQQPGSKVTKPGYGNKAVLAITGQVEHPGESLAVILRDTQWTTDADLEVSSIGRELLEFFEAVPV